jgi:hypothetical protein
VGFSEDRGWFPVEGSNKSFSRLSCMLIGGLANPNPDGDTQEQPGQSEAGYTEQLADQDDMVNMKRRNDRRTKTEL